MKNYILIAAFTSLFSLVGCDSKTTAAPVVAPKPEVKTVITPLGVMQDTPLSTPRKPGKNHF